MWEGECGIEQREQLGIRGAMPRRVGPKRPGWDIRQRVVYSSNMHRG